MFDIFSYSFMRNALLALLIVAPMYAMLGSAVINSRLAFFTDVLGHSALTGIAIGVLLGMADPTWAMAVLAVLIAIGINYFKTKTLASSDTVIGVFLAFFVALGIVILSRNGGFVKYTSYLIGDILTVGKNELVSIIILFVITIMFWLLFSNKLFLSSINRSLAKSRGINVFWLETGFTILLALIVIFSIKMVGILIINSLIILPAAAARNISRNVFQYTFISIIISMTSSVLGLVTSYYLGSSAGATIVLFATGFYAVSVMSMALFKR